jgi:hypothetical protein
VAREGVTRLAIALWTVAVAIGPARIVIAVPAVLIRSLSLATRTAPQRRRTIVIAVSRPRSGLAPVVFTIAVVGGLRLRGLASLGRRSSSRESWSRGSKSIDVLPFLLEVHGRKRAVKRPLKG